jgi:hypothetical protein
MAISYPLTIPGPVYPETADLKQFDGVGEFMSPFTGQAEQQSFLDQHWELDLEWPAMTWAQFAATEAFAAALHGKTGSFLWGPPLATAPRGLGHLGGTPIVTTNPAAGGPNTAGAGANGPGGLLFNPWANPGGVTGSSSYATVTLGLGTGSTALLCTLFGFAVGPSAPGILGITVTATAFASASGCSLQGQLSNATRSSLPETVALGTAPATVTLGSISDLWGTLPWNPADVNQLLFGVGLKAFGLGTFSVQNVQITLTFTPFNQPGGNVLQTGGWLPSQSGVLLPGDFLELQVISGSPRLYQYAGQVPLATDGGGNAAIDIFPCLREAPIPGMNVILLNPQGTFRLAENRRSAPAKKNKTYTFMMKCREAI